jgi:hypothetical protein
MRRNRRKKDEPCGGAARLYRCPAACREMIRCARVNGRLNVTMGTDREHIRRRRSSATADAYGRIPLQLTNAASARGLRDCRTTAFPGEASQHGHGCPQETHPDGQNGCQATQHVVPPLRSRSLDARPGGRFSQVRAQPWRKLSRHVRMGTWRPSVRVNVLPNRFIVRT